MRATITKLISISIIVFILLLVPGQSLAQSYQFEQPSLTLDYYINADGTASLGYLIEIKNDPSGEPIQYVDVGLPNPNFDESSITAEIDGQPVDSISSSDYQGKGNAGVALDLGSNAIQPGQTGIVTMYVGQIEHVLYPDTRDDAYTSSNIDNSYFGSEYVDGTTNLTVRVHFPPGVQPEESRWHTAPSGWAAEPTATVDSDGRVVYEWNNPEAQPDRAYEFGFSFPRQYISEAAISKPTISQSVEDSTGINPADFTGTFMCFGIIFFIGLIIYGSYRSTEKRKLQYLPPRIAIEGHGIKRGLTAVEAAILLEEPMDKILTMILFSTIKKNAATVLTNEPLMIEAVDPAPEGLPPYELQFLQAFKNSNTKERRDFLRNLMVDLVKSVSNEMKGFSRRETVAYYRDITSRAWAQVQAAETPEVKMDKFSENLEWTMLDKDYTDRTRQVFTGPVVVPHWWGRYDPSFGGSTTRPSVPTSHPSSPGGGGGGLTAPTLPGAAFAGSMVQGVQNFSTHVVGNLTDFTGSITNKTNPVPVTTSSGGRSGGSSGGHSCACACACAGCACACAGGGR